MLSRLRREERAGILAIAAVSLPVLIVVAAFVVDVGNWYSHKRHLQTKVDAGALAAAGKYGGLLPDCTSSVALADQISGVAKQYAGVVSVNPEGVAANPENVGANDSNKLEVYVNSTSYTGADYSDGGNPCFLHADNTRPYAPPDADSEPDGYWTDVKGRERDVPSFFGLFGIPVPSITAKARVELRIAQNVDRTLPFAVEAAKFMPCVWAQFINDSNASLIVEQALTRNPTDVYDWTSPSAVSVSIPASAHVSMRVRAGECADTNHQETFDAEETDPGNRQRGLVFVQTYDLGGSPTATTPRVRDVTLTPTGGTPCADAYFTYIRSGTCEVGISANIQFVGTVRPFARARLCPAGGSTGDPVPGGSCGGWNTLALSGGRWTGTLGTATALTGPHGVEIEHAALDLVGVPGPCKDSGDPWTGGNNCRGSFGIQQRIFLGNTLRSGPVELAEVLDQTGTSKSNAVPRGQARSLRAHVRFQKLGTDDWSDPGIVVRSSVQTSDNRSGALDCDGQNFRDDIINGCNAYQINVRTPVPTCSPVLTPQDCVTGEPGNKVGQLEDGMETRFGCTTNYWRTQGPITIADPRVATVFITNWGAGRRTNGNPQKEYPVLAFAYFYITGWDGDDGFCSQNDPAPPIESGDTKSSVWGHFIDFTGPPSGGTPSDKVCLTFGEAGACLAVLVD